MKAFASPVTAAPVTGSAAPSVSGILLESLHRIIRERAHDPGLCGTDIAAELGWSLRHVQAQLRRHGTTLSHLIREERLALARTLLMDPESRQLSIGQIAAASGFRDLGTFSNSYHRLFGERPSATRARPVPIRMPGF